jgi:hypothetical protein
MMTHRVTGNGHSSTQARNTATFEKVETTGPMDVILTQGPAGVRVETDENLQEYIEVNVSGNTLVIHARKGYSLNPKSGMKVYVSAASFRSVQVTGSGDLTSTGTISGSGLDLDVTGSGNITLAVDMPEVHSEITGSGTIRISGNTRSMRATINGSGDILAFDLKSEDAKVDIAGSGNAEVFASKNLRVDIAGSGDVAYKGTANVTSSVHGSGDVRKAD